MSYTSLAQSTADWALSKVGCAYSQAKRTQENIFDCSSLVARAYATKVCGDQRFQTQHYGNSGNSIAEGRAERIS